MQQINIRKVKMSDLKVLCELIFELSGHEISLKDARNRLSMVNSSPIDSLFICELEGHPCGLLGFRIRENIEEVSKYGEISLIVTHSKMRLKGIGRAMMSFAEKLAQKKGCLGTWLVSGFGREKSAHKFYKQLGYGITGYRFVKRFKK